MVLLDIFGVKFDEDAIVVDVGLHSGLDCDSQLELEISNNRAVNAAGGKWLLAFRALRSVSSVGVEYNATKLLRSGVFANPLN